VGKMKNMKIWLNDGNKNKVINVYDKDKYILKGWKVGKIMKVRK